MSTQPVIIQQKSNGFFSTSLKLIGLICLLCCLSSMWSSYTAAKAVGNAVSNVKLEKKKVVDKPSTSIDMMSMSSSSEMESAVENVSEPVPMTTKQMNLYLYKTPDCTGEPLDAVSLDSGVPMKTKGEFDRVGEPVDTWYACCIETKNANVTGTYHLDWDGQGEEPDKQSITISEDGKVNLSKTFTGEDGSETTICPYDYNFTWEPRE
jgi:hypothetical protein